MSWLDIYEMSSIFPVDTNDSEIWAPLEVELAKDYRSRIINELIEEERQDVEIFNLRFSSFEQMPHPIAWTPESATDRWDRQLGEGLNFGVLGSLVDHPGQQSLTRELLIQQGKDIWANILRLSTCEPA